MLFRYVLFIEKEYAWGACFWMEVRMVARIRDVLRWDRRVKVYVRRSGSRLRRRWAFVRSRGYLRYPGCLNKLMEVGTWGLEGKRHWRWLGACSPRRASGAPHVIFNNSYIPHTANDRTVMIYINALSTSPIKVQKKMRSFPCEATKLLRRSIVSYNPDSSTA